MKALTKTDFNFPGQKSVYHGKVRDVYNINGEKLVMRLKNFEKNDGLGKFSSSDI